MCQDVRDSQKWILAACSHISNKYNKEIKNVRLFGGWILSSYILCSLILEGLHSS